MKQFLLSLFLIVAMLLGSQATLFAQKAAISGSSGGTSVAQNTPVYIALGANITGTENLKGALVFINNNFDPAQDVLGIDGTQSGTTSSISYSYDPSKGILTLTGDEDVATYQSIIQKLTYTNTSATPSTASRSITISLNKALPYSENGHFYEFVPSSGITWTIAKSAAEALDYFGLKGYLVTITSAEENAFCLSKLAGEGWIGASDAAAEGTWKWVSGPENGNLLSYTNWNGGEPNNSGDEDYAHFLTSGKWNDYPNSVGSIAGYVVEYGGSTGDPVLDISDVVTVNVNVPDATAASNIQTYSLNANWNAVSGATNYYLDVATNSSFSTMLSGYNNKNVGNVTTYKLEGLNPATNYFYRIRSTSAATGFNSNIISATTLIETKITGSTGGTSIAQNTPIHIASVANVTGAENLKGALVFINNNFNPAQDVLGIDGTQSGTTSSISYTYDSSKGILMLTGVADVATYQTILRKVTYTNTSATPSTASRSITISLNKALPYSENGHFYEFVPSSGIKWTDAKTAAEGLNYFGLKGYLATITDKDENDFCTTKLSGDGWMGGTDTDTEGTWKWVTGPEAGQTFSYTNWNSGQPDNYLGIEDYAQFYVTGKWNDLPNSEPSIVGYVVEYGGSAGDPTLDISDVVTVDFSIPVSTAASGIQSNSFQANWNTVSGATNYYLDVATNSSFSSILSGYSNKNVGNVTTYKVEGLNPVTTYYYRVRATSLASGYNSNISFATTIKADQTITFNALSAKTYGDIDFSPAATASSGLTVSYTTSDPNVATIAGDLIHIVGTGTCTVYADQSGDDTYNAAPQASQQLTVNKATLTATADAQTKVYGDVNPALTFKYSGWKNSETETVIDTKPIAATTVTYTTSVGTYSITISGGSDNNYSFSYVPADFAVTAATLTVTAEAKTKVYGDINPALTFKYSGWKNNDDDSDLDIKPTASTTVTNTTSVGTYTDVITVSGGADNNYAFSYVPADFKVTAATLTVTADAKTKVYGDDNPTLTFQYSGWKNDDDDSDLDIKPTASTTVTNTTSVGTYTDVITVSGGVDNNYAFSYVPADFKVTAATLTVTADAKTKVYGDDNPTLTFQYSGWKNIDDDSDLDTKPTVSTTVTNTTSVGTYTDVITVSGGADNNYAFSYVPADFEVTAATLTVTADAKTKVYGDVNPALTFKYSGLKNSDDESDLDTKPTASTTVTNTTSVGTYTEAITVSGGADNNYAFSYVPADFEVTAATLTVTAEAKTKVYGDVNPALTFKYSGWKNNDDESDLDTKPTASTTVTNTTSVGTYTDVITVSGGVDNNYDFTYVPANFEVTKAKLKAIANAKTKAYGAPNPALTIHYVGWKNSETKSVLDVEPIAATTVSATTSAGIYINAITVYGGIDNNYDFIYVSGNFTVLKAELVVWLDQKTKNYGEENPTLTYRYHGFMNGDDESVLDFKPYPTTSVTKSSNAGTYISSITMTGGLDDNYHIFKVPANFIVNKATLTVTADAKTKVYGDDNPTLTFQYSGWKNDDDDSDLDIKPTASTTVTNTTSVGTYTDVITVSGGVDNNYAFSYVPADFEVTAATLTVTADAKTKVYGDVNPALTFKYSGWKNNDDESDLDTKPTASTTVTNTTSVGTYTDVITVSGGADNNYAFSYVPADFEVTAATLTVTADAKTKVYGDVNPALTFKYSGWKNNDDESDLDTKPTASTTVTNTTSVGTYTEVITVSGGADNNYAFSYVPADFEITKAMLTVTADSQSKAFGAPNPSLTFQYSGWKNGETESVLNTKPTASTIIADTTPVGTYENAITVSGGSDNNYDFTYVSASFTVNKGKLVIWLDQKTKNYGDENPTLTYRYTGFMNGDDESDLDYIPYPSTSVTRYTNAGTYISSITMTGGLDDNYYIVNVPANFIVNKSPLTVKADNKTKAYGENNPDLTVTYSGWKNGESEAVLDVKPVVSTTVNATTLPGVYPNTITAQAGSDNNYKFEYVAGTFTVTQASQSIVFNALAPKTYGDAPFILSATSNSGLTISYTCTNSDVAIVSGNTVNIIGAGTAVITASQSGDSNYLPAATVSQTFTVNRKPLFVAGITAASKIYDGNANAVLAGGTLSGTINSDVITLNNATSGTFSQTSVGTEIPVSTAMTISGDKVANYVLSLPNLKADITPKVIAVTAKNASRICDQPEQALSYSFEPSLVGTDTFTGTLTRTVGNTPGVYPILQGTLSLGTNYSINFTGASYTIINTKNLAPTVDQPSNLTVLKNSKEVTVTLTGIDPVSNCMAQDIESIVATADNKNLIPEIVVDYTKGQPTAKLKLKIADGLNGETTIHVKLKDNGGTENSGTDTREISFNIKVEIPVGVEDLTQNFDVRVYPNPSKGLIKIETSGFNRPSVRIFKVTGEEIMKKMNLMDPIETMDLGGNAPGIYFVEISDQTNTITKKLILKN